MDRLAPLRRNRFIVLGRAGMALYADPPGTQIETATRFTAALGGSSANIAVALARQGAAAALVTCVSDDAVGRFCRSELQRYGIDTRYLRDVGGEARNSLAVVETRAPTCQSVIYRNGAADFQMEPADIDAIDFAGAGGLIATGTLLASEPSRAATLHAFARARAAGVPVIFDIDHRPYSWASAALASDTCAQAAALSDIVIGNDDEFALLAGSREAGPAAARDLARSSAAFTFAAPPGVSRQDLAGCGRRLHGRADRGPCSRAQPARCRGARGGNRRHRRHPCRLRPRHARHRHA